MKNWDKSAGEFTGQPDETFNNCFIEELMKITENNWLVFQQVGNKAQLLVAHEAGLTSKRLFGLPEDIETKNCFWNNGDPIKGKLFYEWELDPDKSGILIVWDHDLGDVVVDTVDIEVVEKFIDNEDSDFFPEKICENVYFSYIT